MPSAFVCPARALHSSSYSDQISLFFHPLSPPHQQACQLQISDSDPFLAQCKDYHHHTEFHNKISTMAIIHNPSVLFTQKIAIESCRAQVQLCGSWLPGKLSVLRFTELGGGYGGGWGGTNHPVHTSFWQLRKTISWQSSPNKWNRQNETRETLATEESSLPGIKVNNWFVGFCFIF